MTAIETLRRAEAAGITFELAPADALVARPGSAMTDELRQAIKEHKPRLVAVLKLRDLNERMGFDEADRRLIEAALLSGRIDAIEFRAVPAPAGSRPA